MNIKSISKLFYFLIMITARHSCSSPPNHPSQANPRPIEQGVYFPHSLRKVFVRILTTPPFRVVATAIYGQVDTNGTLLKRAAAVLLLAQSVAVTALAQATQPKTHDQQRTPKLNEDKHGIRGYVKDFATNEPLADIAVQVEHSGTSTVTDKHGYFFLAMGETDTQQTKPKMP
ncbi:MAG: hypothetical protein H7258_01860 [Ferruginibacter sp.]|nr:hypothetical protein [Ferruginibacter sp.]